MASAKRSHKVQITGDVAANRTLIRFEGVAPAREKPFECLDCCSPSGGCISGFGCETGPNAECETCKAGASNGFEWLAGGAIEKLGAANPGALGLTCNEFQMLSTGLE